jgi:hypothetical protein
LTERRKIMPYMLIATTTHQFKTLKEARSFFKKHGLDFRALYRTYKKSPMQRVKPEKFLGKMLSPCLEERRKMMDIW